MTNMKQGFNLEELEKNNAHSIRSKQVLCLLSSLAYRPIKGLLCLHERYVPSLAIRGPRLASSILFQSSGLTNGIIEEKDITEELPKQKEKQQEEGEDYSDLDSEQESVEEAGVSYVA